jgi:probable HAF family extracellular repeat protein
MRGSCRFRRVTSAFVVTLLVGTGALLAGSGPRKYRIEDLGTFGGPRGCEEGVHPTSAAANGVNESGDVVGWAQRSVQLVDPDTGELLYYPDTGHAVCTVSSHAALWRNGEIIDLGGLNGYPGGSNAGNTLNDHVQVVGHARVSNSSGHAFLWTAENGMVDLQEDAAALLGTSWGINNFGEITIMGAGAYFRAVNGDLRLIRFPDSPSTTGGAKAYEINDDGIVAGYAYNGDGRFNAFRYDSKADVVENIHDPFFRRSYGYGVNDQGDIAVVMSAPTGHGFGSVVTADGDLVVLPLGKIRDRGQLRPDLVGGGIDDINALGDVVGVDISGGSLPPVAWIAFDVLGDGPLEKIALNDLLSRKDQAEWDIWWSWAINDARQLVGWATHNGRTRAFIMTPYDTSADDDAEIEAANVPSGGTVGANRTGIDPLTGLEGVTNFVPDGMGPNRVVGSLRPPSTIGATEADAVGNVAPLSGPDGQTSGISRRAPGLTRRGADPGKDRGVLDRKPGRNEFRRQLGSRRGSHPTTPDDE